MTTGAAGFSYVEILVAVLLLALCAVPATEAIRTGVGAADIGPTRMQELRCMKTKMESVLAQPYQNLASAAVGQWPTLIPGEGYSEPKGGGCPRRDVYIVKVRRPYNSAGFSDGNADELAMLYVSVSSPDTSYAFTTLVTR
jgi:hypothetical protein